MAGSGKPLRFSELGTGGLVRRITFGLAFVLIAAACGGGKTVAETAATDGSDDRSGRDRGNNDHATGDHDHRGCHHEDR